MRALQERTGGTSNWLWKGSVSDESVLFKTSAIAGAE